jgi:secondary thiamine-phosphate synthase enzyme
VDSTLLPVETGTRLFTDLTLPLADFCAGRGDGLVNVFVPHATAGLALFEMGAGSEADVGAALDRLAPPDADYRHRHGSPGHGADHVIPAFVSPSITLPVLDGAPQLGTWQHLVLVDTNRDNLRRQVRLSFLPG